MKSNPTHPGNNALLELILPHVIFDGWTSIAFEAAVEDAGLSKEQARQVCPGAAADLAILFHQQGDQKMIAAMAEANLSEMRFRDKVAFAVRCRLQAVADKEVVRRASVMFAMPHHAADGAKLIWGTADHIWTELGDTSRDINWYSKRATLSAVYSSCVLFWLGDESPNNEATDAFIDRRIEDVMRIEKVKEQLNDNKFLSPFLAPLKSILSQVKAPTRIPDPNLPGHWSPMGQPE